MVEQFASLEIICEFIEAIDGSKLRSSEFDLFRLCSEKYALVLEGRPLIDAEFGCSLSHLMVYQRMIEQGLPVAVVLEDDVRIGAAFKLFLQELMP